MKRLMLSLAVISFSASAAGTFNAEKYVKQFKKSAKSARDYKKSEWKPLAADLVEEDFRNMCKSDEDQFMQVERSVINPIIISMLKNETGLIANFLSDNAALDLFQTQAQSPKADQIEISSWKNITPAKNKNEFMESLKNYLNEFQKIEDVQFVTKKIKSPISDRQDNYDMMKMTTEVFFEVRGISKSGARRVERGYLDMTFSKMKDSWKIDRFKIASMDTLQKMKPDFEEITAISGIQSMPTYVRTEAIRRGGYALAVADYNNDGLLDMYVGAKGDAKLFAGTSKGSFAEVTVPGLDNMNLVKSAVWADFDNDGFKDLMTVRFTPAEKRKGQKLFKNIVAIYKNISGKEFKKTGGVMESESTDYAMPSAVGDFNNDGLLDVYVGYPGHRDFTTFHKFDHEKAELKTQGVYLNAGAFTFKPSPMSADKNEHYERFSGVPKLYPHSALAADFDQDGNVDILVIDDRGNLSPLYKNAGNGKFVKANGQLQIASTGYGMGAATTDFNNDGLTDLISTSVHYAPFDRITNSCYENWGTSLEKGVKSKALSAFVGVSGVAGKAFAEQSTSLGLSEAGEGLAGVEFLDYNNDGYEDLYVANGLWSGTNRFQELASEFVRTKLLDDTMIFMESRDTSNSIVMQVLSSFKGDMQNGKAKERLSLAGFQRNKLYLNNKKGGFVEVGYLEGVDSIADGYVISRADINNDGKLDLILRNADPGSKEVTFAPVQIYKNNTKNGNFLRINLIGANSNKDAIGAEVKIETDDGVQTRQVIANIGTVQSETTLHFGLNDNTKANKVSVKWPTGKTTEIKNVSAGTIKITEDPIKHFRISGN